MCQDDFHIVSIGHIDSNRENIREKQENIEKPIGNHIDKGEEQKYSRTLGFPKP